jgi:hypothetical protein
MYHLGLYDEDEINLVTQNCQLVIVPHELPKEARFSNETTYNIIQGSDRKRYMLSNRKNKGGQHLLKSQTRHSTVYIHEMRNSRSVLVDTIHDSDKVSNIIPGVTVEHKEYANESSRVEVRFEGNSTAINQEEIRTEPFPEKFTQTELSEQHDGLWHDPLRNGQGLDLHVKDGRAVLAWYHYPDDKPYGTSDWIITSFDLKEGTETFDLWATKGGSFSDPTVAEKVKVGKGQIYFLGPNSGVFQYRTEKFGRGHFPISPVNLDSHEDNGTYYNRHRDGEGFTIRFLDDGQRCLAYWYTYQNKVNDPSTGFQRRRWFLLDGTMKNGTYVLNAMKVDGQFLGVNTDEPLTTVEGQCKIVKVNGDEFRFVSEVPGYELDMMLERLL